MKKQPLSVKSYLQMAGVSEDGAVPGGGFLWDSPVDLFAFCIQIASAIGLECKGVDTDQTAYILGLDPARWPREVKRIGEAWNWGDGHLLKIQWRELMRLDEPLSKYLEDGESLEYQQLCAALLLLIAASDQKFLKTNRTGSPKLKNLTPSHGSIARRSLLPQSGVTLTRLTHTLGYTRAVSNIKAETLQVAANAPDRLNVLLVPAPYTVHRTAITFNTDDTFDYQPPDCVVFLEIVNRLLAAVPNTSEPDIVLFPELSVSLLGPTTAYEIAVRSLTTRWPNTIFAIGLKNEFGNAVEVWVPGMLNPPSRQYKHHPWYLEERQIKGYDLPLKGKAATRRYRENMLVKRRELSTVKFRCGTTFNFLICEDLGRPEPVGSYLCATGPTMVFAHLLDAAQLGHRWPGKSAEWLRTEAGSTVVSITSSGMARLHKSASPGHIAIGLVTDEKGQFQLLADEREIAVMATFTRSAVRQRTLDGRESPPRTQYTLDQTSVIPFRP